MNIQIINDEKKQLLKKRTLTGKLGYEGKTPGRLELRKEIAHKLNAKEELVLVKQLKPDYGNQSAHFIIEIYDDAETMKQVEQNYMLLRHGQGEQKESKPAEEAAEKK
ncbi:30S ribosomal protein S24e [Candidatus Woesearchaeota archaeon]|nr:30S ribosomal protein S24e [Candidatus Woesearchaeota archaeon]